MLNIFTANRNLINFTNQTQDKVIFLKEAVYKFYKYNNMLEFSKLPVISKNKKPQQ